MLETLCSPYTPENILKLSCFSAELIRFFPQIYPVLPGALLELSLHGPDMELLWAGSVRHAEESPREVVAFFFCPTWLCSLSRGRLANTGSSLVYCTVHSYCPCVHLASSSYATSACIAFTEKVGTKSPRARPFTESSRPSPHLKHSSPR